MSGDGSDEAEDRRQAIEAQLDALSAPVWSGEAKARAGAVVSLAYDGTAAIDRGLIRPEDGADETDESGAVSADPDAGTEAEAGPPALPASLIEDLTAQKTAALRIETARNPDIALALTVHALAGSLFYPHGRSALKAHVLARSLRPSIRQFADCPAVQALEAERERLGDMLPGSHDDLWGWCLTTERDTLLDVLAVAVAHGIDAVESKADSNRAGRDHGAALAEALKLDMAAWYRPTAAGYFSRIGKAQILTDLEAARGAPGAPAWTKLKKAELAELAERETAERVWLPSPLQ